jgi:hypothetical protein
MTLPFPRLQKESRRRESIKITVRQEKMYMSISYLHSETVKGQESNNSERCAIDHWVAFPLKNIFPTFLERGYIWVFSNPCVYLTCLHQPLLYTPLSFLWNLILFSLPQPLSPCFLLTGPNVSSSCCFSEL